MLKIRWILLVLWVPSAVFAQPRESQNWLLDSRFTSTHERFVDTFKFPGLPVYKGLTVIGLQFASYGNVYLLAPETTPVQDLTAILETWRTAQGLEGEVLYSTEGECSVAVLSFRRPEVFAKSSKTSVDIGALHRKVKEMDSVAQIGWLVPNYATPMGLPKGDRGNRSTIYDLSDIPGSEISVTAETYPLTLAVVAFFAFYVPVVLLIGILVGIYVARLESIPIARRRVLYTRIVYGSLIGSIATHLPLVFYVLASDLARVMADVWFSSRPTSVLGPALMIGILIPLAVLPLSQKIERKLFGHQSGDPQPSKPKSASREPFSTWAFLRRNWLRILGLGLWVVALNLPGKNELKPLLRLGGFLLFLSPWASFRELKKTMSSLLPASDATQSLADDIAMKIGIERRKVHLAVPSDEDPINAMVWSDKMIIVTPGFEEHLSEPEKSFILAHEFAHIQQRMRSAKGRLVLMLPIAFLFIIPLYSIMFRKPLPSWVFVGGFVVFVCTFAVQLLLIRQRSHRDEFDADRVAFEVTGDLEAAISALKKVQFGSSMPYAHDMDLHVTHPAMWRRIKALQELATATGTRHL